MKASPNNSNLSTASPKWSLQGANKSSDEETQTGVVDTMKRKGWKQSSPIGHAFINTKVKDRLIHIIASNHLLGRQNEQPTNPAK